MNKGIKMKNIVFDVGGVLIKSVTKEFIRARLTYKQDAEIVYNEFFRSVERVMSDRGTISKEERLARALSRIPERSRKEAEKAYEDYATHREVVNGMPELLQKLKDDGYKLYVLSNFGKNYRELIDKNGLGFFRLFDGVFVSAFYGAVKPEREIYKLFLEKFGLRAQECFFIDDKEENVEGAINAGMQGFVFRGNAKELEKHIETIAGVQ